MTIAIRPFALSDTAAVGALIVAIQHGEFGVPITYDDQPDLKDIPGFYMQGNGGFWVAEADGAVVGTIGLKDIGQADGALRKFFVAEAARGAATGVAKGLMDALLDHGRARRLRTIYLGTTANMAAAHRFYEKSGFRSLDVAALPDHFLLMPVDSRIYWIDLQDR